MSTMQTIWRSFGRPARASGLVIALAFFGCASSGLTNYTPTTAVPPVPKGVESELMTYLPPARPFVVVGTFQTDGFDTPDVTLKGMREKAAELGLDGISEIHCNAGKVFIPMAGLLVTAIVNHGRNGDCAGQGFIWRQP
jgi:hypothetical protein